MNKLYESVRARMDDRVIGLWDKIENYAGLRIDICSRTNGDGVDPNDPDDALLNLNHDRAEIVLSDPDKASSATLAHELLHIRRYWMEDIPQIVPLGNDDAKWRMTGEIENDIEHLFVLPRQRLMGYDPSTRFDPILRRAWDNYPWPHLQAGQYRTLSACLAWMGAKQLASDRSISTLALKCLEQEGLLHTAQRFVKRIEKAAPSKKSMLSAVIEVLGIPPSDVVMLHLDVKGRKRRVIPFR